MASLQELPEIPQIGGTSSGPGRCWVLQATSFVAFAAPHLPAGAGLPIFHTSHAGTPHHAGASSASHAATVSKAGASYTSPMMGMMTSHSGPTPAATHAAAQPAAKPHTVSPNIQASTAPRTHTPARPRVAASSGGMSGGLGSGMPLTYGSMHGASVPSYGGVQHQPTPNHQAQMEQFRRMQIRAANAASGTGTQHDVRKPSELRSSDGRWHAPNGQRDAPDGRDAPRDTASQMMGHH